MRCAFSFLAFTLLAGVASQSSANQDSTVPVRSYAALVRFRETIPTRELPDDEMRHLSRLETLHADRQALGPAEDGGEAPWIHMKNRASGDDGWSLAKYVTPIDPADAEKLRQLPFSREPVPAQETEWQQFDSKWHLSPIATIASILGILVTLLGGVLWLFRKTLGRTTERPQSVPNVIPFPAAPANPVLFGMANGQVWFHRPRKAAGTAQKTRF